MQEGLVILIGFTIQHITSTYNDVIIAQAAGRSGQSVIIKYPNHSILQNNLHSQWEYECSITKNIHSPYILKCIKLQKNDAYPILIHEQFDSVSLAELINANELRLTTKLEIICHLAEAINDVHAAKLLHRNLSPKNILVSTDNKKLKLCDLSLASQLGKEQSNPENLKLWDSLTYISPELTGRTNLNVDYRSDFYSLGTIFFELLTGSAPFSTDDAITMLHSHIARLPVMIDTINPTLPSVLAKLVNKLLAKSPDERYQSSFGLIHDCKKCLDEWKEKGHIDDFELGTHDTPAIFCIPQKLYGRTNELNQLIDCFANTAKGKPELVLISGFSGVGKTSLVVELQSQIMADNAIFVSGKCDQYNRNQPYTALIKAFRPYIQQICHGSIEKKQQWSQRFAYALGDNAAVLVDLFPELVDILEYIPALPFLPPAESEARFQLAFTEFVKCLSSNGHPVVVFLDDLQWADLPTLKLIEHQINTDSDSALLIIGAYRDNEIDEAHPLYICMQNLSNKQGDLLNISLSPLELHHTQSIIADTLKKSPANVHDIAKLCHHKTQGNPFFLNQFITTLNDQGDIFYDHACGQWQWDLQSILRQDLTDNVVELMLSKLKRLDKQAQQLMSLAAHLGNEFELNKLALVNESSIQDTAYLLWPALQSGLVLPLDEDYKYHQSPKQLERSRYRFLHDRVQQASYNLIDSEALKPLQLTIGRLLLQSSTEDNLNESLFTILEPLNLARDLISDRDEIDRLRALNLQGGMKAKSSSAYSLAVQLLRIAKELLFKGKEECSMKEALDIYRELSEAEYLAGNFAQAEQLYEEGDAFFTLRAEKITLKLIQASQYQLQGRFTEVIPVLTSGLALFDTNMPTSNDVAKEQLPPLFQETESLLLQYSNKELLSLPAMTSGDHFLKMQLHIALVAAYYFTGQNYCSGINSCRMMQLTLAHGKSDFTALSYITYMVVMALMGEEYPRCFKMGKLAVQLSDIHENKYIRSAVYQYFSSAYQHWCEPLPNSFHYLKTSWNWGKEGINLVYAGYAAVSYCMNKIMAGVQLSDLEIEIKQALAFLDTTHQKAVSGYVYITALQPVLSLQGQTDHPLTFNSSEFNIEEYGLNDLETPSMDLALYSCSMLRHSYYLENWTLHHKLSKNVPLISAFMPDTPTYVESLFYSTMGSLKYLNKDTAGYADILKQANRTCELLQKWAQYNETNFQHKFLLLSAEIARIEGYKEQAMTFYDQAIDASKVAKVIQCEALANELYAHFWVQQRQPKIAQQFMSTAYSLYKRWGALAKCQLIEQSWPFYVFSFNQTNQIPNKKTHSVEPKELFRSNEQIDLHFLLKANQLLAKEIHIHSLLEKMLALLLKNAGAEQGQIILADEDNILNVEIAGKTNNGDINCHLVNRKLSDWCSGEYPLLPESLIRYVQQSQTTLVINNPVDDPRFSHNIYLQQHHPKSVLCLPIVGQGKLIALVYLENNLTIDAFTPSQQQVLEMLSSQAAVSLVNARLYDNLEVKVRKRTEALRQLAMKDGLTGVFNRRMFDDSLHKMLDNPLKQPLSLLMIDIDHFKQYNDYYGHLKGDNCIKRVAAALEQQATQSGGVVCRYGGEEFAILLPQTPLGEAIKLAEECLIAIKDLELEHITSSTSDCVTISVGISNVETTHQNDKATGKTLICQADEALYRAKKSGRNQLFLHQAYA